jgi:hypothetical protein
MIITSNRLGIVTPQLGKLLLTHVVKLPLKLLNWWVL